MSGCGTLNIMAQEEICLPSQFLAAKGVSGLSGTQYTHTFFLKSLTVAFVSKLLCLVWAASFHHDSALDRILFSTRDVLKPHMYNLQKLNESFVSSDQRN